MLMWGRDRNAAFADLHSDNQCVNLQNICFIYQHKKTFNMPELKTSVADMVAAARQRIEEVETEEMRLMVDDPSVVIVDLRDVRERQRSGYILGSFHCPRGMAEFWVDPKNPYYEEIFGEDKRFVFHCASGWRSALTVVTLQDMGFDAAHMKDGFSGWEKAGGPIEFPEDAKNR